MKKKKQEERRRRRLLCFHKFLEYTCGAEEAFQGNPRFQITLKPELLMKDDQFTRH
jgi:hypothetical protein